MEYTIIDTFRDIEIIYKTLILCDIDETIMKFDNIDKDWWRLKFDNIYKSNNDYDLTEKILFENWINIIKETEPVHTDNNGFEIMMKKIKETQSTLNLITARNLDLKDLTEYHLDKINVNNITTYYTNNSNKGEFIKNNIDLTLYNKIIFIDDYEFNIESVKDIFGDSIQYYLFEKN